MSVRTKKVSSYFQERLAQCLLLKINDPDIQKMVITRVELSGDLKIAWIYFNLLEGVSFNKIFLKHIHKQIPIIKKNLAPYFRVIPEMRFEYDKAFEAASNVHKLIDSLKKNSDERSHSSSR